VTVAILPELDEVEDVEINPGGVAHRHLSRLGRGGQHVNKTDSAMRVTHLP
jgi:peptide chain release factor 1